MPVEEPSTASIADMACCCDDRRQPTPFLSIKVQGLMLPDLIVTRVLDLPVNDLDPRSQPRHGSFSCVSQTSSGWRARTRIWPSELG